jgi:hypothetical protein
VDTTDLQGNVTYLGVNLSKFGLSSLAELVTKNNSIPSLQLKGQGKSTVTSQVDFVIPQTDQDAILLNRPKMRSSNFAGLVAPPPPGPIPLNQLKLRPCIKSVKYYWLYLRLREALDRYKGKLYAPEGTSGTFYTDVCQPKLTISTQFQLLFDVSAGVNPFIFANPIILPISGLNVDASPDYTHFLQIVFSIRENEDNKPACTNLKPTITPSH